MIGSNTWRRPGHGRPPMSGRTSPDTIPTGYAHGHYPARMVKYPVRAGLSARQREVLELLRHRPRHLRELAEALNIGEWSICAQAAHQLCNRGLAEIVPDAAIRPTWKAVA